MKRSGPKADLDLEQVQRAIEADWEFTEGHPPEARRFEAMHTNSDGDRWWARVEDKRLAVWGSDVGSTATTRPGRVVKTLPWSLRLDEQLWLQANLERLKDEP